MSKSYKLRVYKYSPVRKRYWKRQASKRVRRAASLDNNAYYKRVYNSWNIADCKYDGRYRDGRMGNRDFRRGGIWHVWR